MTITIINTSCDHNRYHDAQTRYDHEAQELVHMVVCGCGHVIKVVDRTSYTPNPEPPRRRRIERGRCGTCGNREGVVCDLCGNGLTS